MAVRLYLNQRTVFRAERSSSRKVVDTRQDTYLNSAGKCGECLGTDTGCLV
jgi:hypothetical protein